ncbi:hypothetical protein L1887_38775 [Cichorium endivia]|nr:hypothetical protein L1887_38775 [Cichorium endivia]
MGHASSNDGLKVEPLVPWMSSGKPNWNLLRVIYCNTRNSIPLLRTLSSKLSSTSRPKKSLYHRRSFKSSFSSSTSKSNTSNCSKIVGSKPVFDDNVVVLGIETTFHILFGVGFRFEVMVKSSAKLYTRRYIEYMKYLPFQSPLVLDYDYVYEAWKIAAINQLPVVGVDHMEAHALVPNETTSSFSSHISQSSVLLFFTTKMGHNLLVLACDLGDYLQMGTTIDDMIGEAYDKSTKWLGLDLRSSGEAVIEELARKLVPILFP